MDLAERLRIALERAVQEGRNVVPDATDREAHLIESLAAHLLIAVELADHEADNPQGAWCCEEHRRQFVKSTGTNHG